MNNNANNANQRDAQATQLTKRFKTKRDLYDFLCHALVSTTPPQGTSK